LKRSLDTVWYYINLRLQDSSSRLSETKQGRRSSDQQAITNVTQMLNCIQASITDECTLKVVTSGETYEVEVKNGDEKEMVQDGPS